MLVTPFERMQGRAYTEISVCGNRVTFVTINGVAHMAKLLVAAIAITAGLRRLRQFTKLPPSAQKTLFGRSR
jgi:hypothetical protein